MLHGWHSSNKRTTCIGKVTLVSASHQSVQPARRRLNLTPIVLLGPFICVDDVKLVAGVGAKAVGITLLSLLPETCEDAFSANIDVRCSDFPTHYELHLAGADPCICCDWKTYHVSCIMHYGSSSHHKC